MIDFSLVMLVIFIFLRLDLEAHADIVQKIFSEEDERWLPLDDLHRHFFEGPFLDRFNTTILFLLHLLFCSRLFSDNEEFFKSLDALLLIFVISIFLIIGKDEGLGVVTRCLRVV